MKKREVAPLASPNRHVASDGGPVRASGALVAMLAVAGLGLSSNAHASFLTPEKLDVAAFYLAWFIVIVFPIAGIVVFLMVHMLPEKIAERRQHPPRYGARWAGDPAPPWGGALLQGNRPDQVAAESSSGGRTSQAQSVSYFVLIHGSRLAASIHSCIAGVSVTALT